MFLFPPSPHFSELRYHKTSFPSWICEFGLLGDLIFRESIYNLFELVKNRSISRSLIRLETVPAACFEWCCSKVGHKAAEIPAAGMTTILDLPDLALDCILANLTPADLCNLAGVCRYLRESCASDFLWKRLTLEKWGGVIGEAAFTKWELQTEAKRGFGVRARERVGWLAWLRPLSWFGHKTEDGIKPSSSLPADSLVSFYLALESGRFTFPAQIYNRENGNAGFLMSCYDAEISYSSRKNKFYARYPPHGKKVPAIEEVSWERIRAPSVGTSAHDLHISSCLSDLNPGDHIEVQWRKKKEFPYGWWYGVVGHLEVCDRGEDHCCCNASDTVVLEFNHYSPGSRWRKKIIDRKRHREDGNENDGFYGGVMKIQKKEEISMWMKFWPTEVPE